jgi:hypothetical protein
MKMNVKKMNQKSLIRESWTTSMNGTPKPLAIFDGSSTVQVTHFEVTISTFQKPYGTKTKHTEYYDLEK